jgi:hypothetical protein
MGLIGKSDVVFFIKIYGHFNILKIATAVRAAVKMFFNCNASW